MVGRGALTVPNLGQVIKQEPGAVNGIRKKCCVTAIVQSLIEASLSSLSSGHRLPDEVVGQ